MSILRYAAALRSAATQDATPGRQHRPVSTACFDTGFGTLRAWLCIPTGCARHKQGTLSAAEHAGGNESHHEPETQPLFVPSDIAFISISWYNLVDRFSFFAVLRVLSAGSRRPWFRVAATKDRPVVWVLPRVWPRQNAPLSPYMHPSTSGPPRASSLFSACASTG